MKFSGYLIFVSAVILIVFAQQSDAGILSVFRSGLDAIKNALNIGNKNERDTIKNIISIGKEYQGTFPYFNATIIDLREAYINGTKQLATSEDIILDAIKSVKKLILEKPEAAKKLLQKSFEDARNVLFKSGIPVLKANGKAFGLLNERARLELMAAIQLIQKVGLTSLDALNTAESLFVRGIAAGDNAAEVLIKAMRLTVKSGFSAGFSYLQESNRKANQAIRDAALSRPTLRQVENLNCGDVAANDSEASDAIKDIYEAVKNALKRGANPKLVQKFTQVLLCALSETVNKTANGKQTVENIKTISVVEPLAAKMTFFRQAEAVKNVIYDEISKIVLVLGDVALKSGSLSESEVEAAIIALEESLIEIFLGIDTAGDLIVNGLRYGGDALKLAIEAAAKTGFYGKLAFVQGIVKVSKLVLKVI